MEKKILNVIRDGAVQELVLEAFIRIPADVWVHKTNKKEKQN